MKGIITTILTLAAAAGYTDQKTVIIQPNDGGASHIILRTSAHDRLYVGPEVFWYNDSPTIKGIHIKGHNVYYGVRAGYDFLQPNTLYAGIDGLYALGRVHIKARKHDTKVSHGRVMGDFANLEGRLGYNFQTPNDSIFSPYVGIGGYHLRPFHSVKFVQNWLYLAVGIKSEFPFNRTFSMGVNVKGMRALYLDQRFKKEHVSGTYHNTANALGYAIGLPLTWRMGPERNTDLQLEPYFLKLNTNSNSSVIGARLTFSLRY